MKERPFADVPKTVLVGLALMLSLHMTLKAFEGRPAAGLSDLTPAPSVTILRLASLGDPAPLAKMMMLYVQSFDMHAANPIRYQAMNYDGLIGWLTRILQLDPHSQYPLHTASRIYAEVPDPARQRKMLDFVYAQFLIDPKRRWPSLAHAAYIARHQLKDLDLARRYATAIQAHAQGPDIPLWARQMEAFILEDMDELEAARIMIGGFIASGQVKEPGELRFLEERLVQIEQRLKPRNADK